jgi:Xaa-Pro aminopeptidase
MDRFYQTRLAPTSVIARGAERTSFASISGSGPNPIIIHDDQNTRKAEPGDPAVMDVGAENSEFADVITRTIAISERFTSRQREIYEIALEARSRPISACRPGATFNDIDAAARN